MYVDSSWNNSGYIRGTNVWGLESSCSLLVLTEPTRLLDLLVGSTFARCNWVWNITIFKSVNYPAVTGEQ